MTYTLDETGKALTETLDGVTMPADYGFSTVNDFVHGVDVSFEDLQSLCLGMASYIEAIQRGEFICQKCFLRKSQERSVTHDF